MTDKQLDLLAEKIADKMAERPCPLGLTHEEAPQLKSWVSFMTTTAQTTTKVVVTAVVTAVFGLVLAGCYMKFR